MEPPDLLSFTPAENWERVLPEWRYLRGTPEGRRLVLAGVPRDIQAKLLHASLVESGTETEDTFERAAAAAATLRERLDWDWDGSLRRAQPRLDELAVVSADVPRTLPESQRRGLLSGAQLQRLLDAFVASQADADADGGRAHGYTQGMADVAAWLLQHDLVAWQAYACLHALTRRPLLRAVMGLDQQCWDALTSVYSAVLARCHPRLAAHLDSLGLMPFFFLPEWLVALWTRSLPADVAALAWNLLLVEGDAFFCVHCAVGVSCAIAPQLLASTDLAGCRDECRDAPKQLSLDAFRHAALAVSPEAALLQPLAPWVDEAAPVARMFEL